MFIPCSVRCSISKMAAPMEDEFDKWLGKKLISLNPEVDLDVFVQYIKGILETETEEDDILESMGGIMGEILDGSDSAEDCKEILKEWQKQQGQESHKPAVPEDHSLEATIHSMLEKHTAAAATKQAKEQSNSGEAAARKAAILAQYAQVSDGEQSDDNQPSGAEGATAAALSDEILLAKNMNAASISQQQQEMRMRNKQEHEMKKTKDKDDREKQKQKAVERKDAEKKRTQKGERRR